jgi:hypothetical protein
LCHFGGVMRPAVEEDLTLLGFGPCLSKRRSNLSSLFNSGSSIPTIATQRILTLFL